MKKSDHEKNRHLFQTILKSLKYSLLKGPK